MKVSALEKVQLVICICNEEHEASLELRKIYESLSDPDAKEIKMIRIIDESGEDYLYPENYFVPVNLKASAKEAVIKAA